MLKNNMVGIKIYCTREVLKSACNNIKMGSISQGKFRIENVVGSLKTTSNNIEIIAKFPLELYRTCCLGNQ